MTAAEVAMKADSCSIHLFYHLPLPGVCNLNMSKSGLLGMDKFTWCLGLRKNGEMVAFHNKNQVNTST